uniref:Uncharacterized protein n=1 Tax=Salvator merianae TaxID=96440 RepID=A0A8D0BXM6_SALMN
MGEEASLRWRFWALWLPCCCLLWERLVAGMESTASPSPPAPVISCTSFSNKTCEECVRNTKCLWCSQNSACMDYPVSKLLPPSSVCALNEARWAICWVNFEALIITMSVVSGVLLLLVGCCCCCCCYRYRYCCYRHCCCCCYGYHPRRRLAEEEERFIRDQEERRMQSLQRKHERKAKHDEIRKKYGLLQDSDHPYSRYENE